MLKFNREKRINKSLFICLYFSCSSEYKKPIFSFSFSKIFTATIKHFEHRSTHSILFKMEKLLAIIKPTAQPDEVEMDPDKVKFFNSKLKVWDFAKISPSEFRSLSSDDKLLLLKNYYVEMSCKYTEGRGKPFFYCCLAIFWLCFD